jgi:hypothetical protein
MSNGRTAKDVCRMILYTIDRALKRESAQIIAIVIFHALNGLSKNNMDPSIAKLLISAIIGHFPIRIEGIYALNAPFFFRGIIDVADHVASTNQICERYLRSSI